MFAPLLLAVVLAGFGGLSWLDDALYDAQFRWPTQGDAYESPIVIVAIDDASLATHGRWPWTRERVADLLDKVTDAGVRAVGLDILLIEPNIENPEGDRRLAEAMARNGHVVLPIGLIHKDKTEAPLELMPYAPFMAEAAGLGHALIEHDGDGVVRHSKPWTGSWPSFSLAVFDQAVFPADTTHQPRGMPALLGIDFGLVRQPRAPVSASDLLNGRHIEPLRDKIVLIGVTAQGIAPLSATPSPGPSGLMNGLELQAATLDTLLSRTYIQRLPPPYMILAATAFMLMWLVVVMRSIQSRGLLPHLLTMLVSVLLSMVLLWTLDAWLPPSPMLAALVLSHFTLTLRQLRHVEDEAGTDPLTGLANRRRLASLYQQNKRRAERLNHSLILLLLDIDHFKKYNDHYGHQAGDEVLRAVGKILEKSVRNGTDIASRLGGEEFAILLSSHDVGIAEEFAERLLLNLEQTGMPHEASPLGRLSTSIGIAIDLNARMDFTSLYEAADRSLYAAKNHGRNRFGPIETLRAHPDLRTTPTKTEN